MASHETFFRLVDGSPVKEQDFWSLKQRVDAGLQRMPPQAMEEEECVLVGTSIFDDAEAVQNLRKAVGPLKRKRVAAGSLGGSGVVKKTRGPNHHTWWRPDGDEAWRDFVVQP